MTLVPMTVILMSLKFLSSYAPAEFYDEQPLTLDASIKQRRRWVKGFYQVFFSYGGQLVRSIAQDRSFAAYDLLMVIAPATLLTLISLLANATFIVVGGMSHGFLVTDAEMQACLGSILMTLLGMYGVFFLLALMTTVFEWRHIHCPQRWRVVANLFTYCTWRPSKKRIVREVCFACSSLWVTITDRKSVV